MVLGPAFIGGFGGPELLIVLFIAVILFGGSKIPELARSTGKAMGEFQKGREEVEEELQEMRDGAEETADDVATEVSTDDERA